MFKRNFKLVFQRVGVPLFLILAFVVLLCFIVLPSNITELNSETKPNKYSLYSDKNKKIKIYKINETKMRPPKSPSLQLCPLIPPNLVGRFDIDLSNLDEKSIEIELQEQDIQFGGKWMPSECKPRYHVAILIPYRNRLEHLHHFLLNMHPFFSKQQLSYGIYVIEPIQNITFNRGILMNIGFIESNKDSNNRWQCHSFHDVDMIAEDDRNLYNCPDFPKHLTSSISSDNYILKYDGYFGGVTLLKKEHYILANGYSNLFFGWGGEDDDHLKRILFQNISMNRSPSHLGRYYMASHKQDLPNPNRYLRMQNNSLIYENEGLNTVNYQIIKMIKKPLYTKLLVDYNETELLNSKYI